MPLDYVSLAAVLALILSIVDSLVIIWDRMPRLRIGIHAEVDWGEADAHGEDDEDVGTGPVAYLLWIDIANHAAKRIWVTSMTVEWSRYFPLPFGRQRVNLPDLQRWEAEGKVPTARFWIEPWGDAVLSADAGELEYEIKGRKRSGRVWYHIAVCDGLGNWYRSNKIMLKIPIHNEAAKT